MIRYPFICNQVLQLYTALEKITFPLQPDKLFELFNNCKAMTYQRFAELNGCSVNDVILLCESKSGCTHYDVANGRYLVLVNESTADNNVQGRILWTKGHELGHVTLKHLPLIAEAKIAENTFCTLSNPELESEADYFASVLLCPMPLYKQLGVESACDIQRVFGLSSEASVHRWDSYIRWLNNHRKTAWENDMKRIYAERS